MVKTLGSLFDGISGFPLAASRCGITPVWASEIDKPAIVVARKHFPNMLQFGDIRKLNGANIPSVDVITGGSPCQDLSLAGHRVGLTGEKSSLFLEMIRIIEEMQEATHGKKPRYVIWENVRGAFVSNNGEDFKRVIEEFSGATVPSSPVGAWTPAGLVLRERRSFAWRQFDSQYFGVCQQRKRIYSISDYSGRRAGELLFERCSARRTDKKTTLRNRTIEGHKFKSWPPRGLMFSMGSELSYFDEIVPTLCATCGASANNLTPLVNIEGKRWRRLTPEEWEKIQGFPPGWTACTGLSDAARYKMLGNSITPAIAESIFKRMQ